MAEKIFQQELGPCADGTAQNKHLALLRFRSPASLWQGSLAMLGTG